MLMQMKTCCRKNPENPVAFFGNHLLFLETKWFFQKAKKADNDNENENVNVNVNDNKNVNVNADENVQQVLRKGESAWRYHI